MKKEILPFNIPYAAIAQYSPKGISDIAVKSRALMYRVKNGDRKVIAGILEKYKAEVSMIENPYLLNDVTFVPVPRSSPIKKGDLWPGMVIAEELIKKSYGKDIKQSINRIKSVPKSAFSEKGNRPTLAVHYNSLQASIEVTKPKKILLIDDIITKGATTAACYMRLKEAFPDSKIAVFAFIRTKGNVPDIDTYILPFQGKIIVDPKTDYTNRGD